MKNSLFKLVLTSLLMFLINFSVNAEEKELGECQDSGALSGKMITDVPWNAMFPIKLAGVTMSSGDKSDGAPDDASNDFFCNCSDDLGVMVPGFPIGMFEPARLIELVREPDCMMSLGGAELNMTSGRMRGTGGHNEQIEGASAAFWHYHYFAYPLILMLEMYAPNRCGDGYLSMDLLYFSELDATWTDPELSFFANPESIVFSNPISIASCLADALASSTDQPIDEMFWCAGSWGSVYPFSGYISGKSSLATKTSLLATRSVAALHRRLLARKTMGKDHMCSADIYPTIPKSQYKMNMLYPVAESQDAHQIGETALKWGEWRSIPSKEDAVYLLWRWNDCCQTYY